MLKCNSFGVVDLIEGILICEIEVGVVFYDVCFDFENNWLFVLNMGGCWVYEGDLMVLLVGIEMVIDEWGIVVGGILLVIL